MNCCDHVLILFLIILFFSDFEGLLKALNLGGEEHDHDDHEHHDAENQHSTETHRQSHLDAHRTNSSWDVVILGFPNIF